MDYLDFDLVIGPRTEQGYQAEARSKEAGEPISAMMRSPFEEQTLKQRLDYLRIALQSPDIARDLLAEKQAVQDFDVKDFGKRLFEELFTDQVGKQYAVSRDRAKQARPEQKGLRLRLHIRVPELAAIPWEFLHDPDQPNFMSISPRTPIIRYLDMPQSVPSLRVKPPLRILGMIASPSDLPKLDIEREKKRMQEALQSLDATGLIKLDWVRGQSWRDLQLELSHDSWHVFHFIGHGGFDSGKGEGLIALANDTGQSHLLIATQFGSLLADHGAIRLALLNACEGARGTPLDIFSSTASTLARGGIPAVLAMQYKITDDAAIEFTRTFYNMLASGKSAEEAVAEARQAMYLTTNTLEWGTPVLYMRSPKGVLVDLKQKPAVPVPPSIAPSLGTFLYTCQGHSDFVETVAWSPDSKRFASGSRDTTVQVWDVASGSNTLTYQGHSDVVWAVTWSPDGKRLASASDDATVQVWDAIDGDHLLTYEGHPAGVLGLAWSRGGEIASGSRDTTVQVWDAASGVLSFTYRGHAAGVWAVAWSPDGTHIASASEDNTVQVWDATNGDNVITYHGHSSWIWAVAWSPDGKRIASGGADKVVQVWDVMDGSQVYTYHGHTDFVDGLAWSQDSKHIASASRDHTVQVWDATSGARIFTYRGHPGVVTTVALSPDGKHFASGSWDHTVPVWQAL